jgi:transcriptional regulator with XRE-family HTH domain
MSATRNKEPEASVCLSPGLALRARRQALGMPQASLAAMLGISQSSYSKWEQRAIPPPDDRVALLAKLLSASPRDIRDGRVPRRMVHAEWVTDIESPWLASHTTTTDTRGNYSTHTHTHPPTSGVLGLVGVPEFHTDDTVGMIRDDLAYLRDHAPHLLEAASAILRLMRLQVEEHEHEEVRQA